MFDPFSLASSFAQKKVTPQIQQNYLWAFAILGAIFGVFVSTMPLDASPYVAGATWENYLQSAVAVIGAILPLFFFLYGNTQGDGEDPVVRYMLLSFDAYLRYGLLAVVMVMIVTVVTTWVSFPSFLQGGWLQILFWSLFHLVIAWHMFVAGKIAAGAQK